MKKGLLTLTIILMASVSFAAVGDITKAEVRKDVVSYKLDTVKFLIMTKTAEITYRKVDVDGNPAGSEVKVLFRNVSDDPDTVDVDETDTSFSDLVSAINSGSNIKQTITTKVKEKLGL